MIHLDTHVLVWLLAGELQRLPTRLVATLPSLAVRVSPMVVLELQYLHEIGRLRDSAVCLMERLQARLDLREAEEDAPAAAPEGP